VATEADLLGQIIASPADGEPRLVLADVLLQRGEPRGELIAIQCLLEKLPAHQPVGDKLAIVFDLHGRKVLAKLRH